MPTVSRFYGITIYFYHNDHAPPHFHARHDGLDAAVHIETLEFLDGSLKPRASALVREWALLHRDELMAAWTQCRNAQRPNPIPPLE